MSRWSRERAPTRRPKIARKPSWVAWLGCWASRARRARARWAWGVFRSSSRERSRGAAVGSRSPPLAGPGGGGGRVGPWTAGSAIRLPFLALHSLAAALLAARFRFLPDALAGAGGVGVTLLIAVLVRGHGLGPIPFALAGGELVAAAGLLIALRRSGLPIVLTLARPGALKRFVRL